MLLFILFLPVSDSCTFLNNFKSVGATPDDVEFPMNYPLIVYNKIAFKADAYLIIHTNLNETLTKINLHKSNKFWKRDSIVCVKSRVVDVEIFKSLWSLQVGNVVLETPTDSFVFNPFNNTILTLRKNTFFKIWTNLYGYEIPISVFQHNLSFYSLSVGIDGCFLYELSQWMNFTPVFIEGRNYSYSIKQLKQKKTEIGGVAQFFKYYGKDIQLTSVLYHDELCFAMKAAGVFRGWDMFLSAFQWQVWAVLMSTALVTNSILTIMCPRLDWKGWLPVTLRAMCMVPSDRPPKTFKERLIIGGCLLFGVVIVTSLQAILYNFIHTRIHYKNPQKVSEIAIPKMRLKYVTDELLKKYAVKTRLKEIDFAIMTGKIETPIHIVPEYLTSFNLGYPLRYGSPYHKYVYHFTQTIFESGIHKAWYIKTVFAQKTPRSFQILPKVRVLNLLDFEVAVFILLAGHFVSLVVCVLEIISKSASNRIFKAHLDPFTAYID